MALAYRFMPVTSPDVTRKINRKPGLFPTNRSSSTVRVLLTKDGYSQGSPVLSTSKHQTLAYQSWHFWLLPLPRFIPFSCLSLLKLETCGSRLTSSTMIPLPRFTEMFSSSLRSEDPILACCLRISYIVEATSEVAERILKTVMILRVHGKVLKWLGLLAWLPARLPILVCSLVQEPYY